MDRPLNYPLRQAGNGRKSARNYRTWKGGYRRVRCLSSRWASKTTLHLRRSALYLRPRPVCTLSVSTPLGLSVSLSVSLSLTGSVWFCPCLLVSRFLYSQVLSLFSDCFGASLCLYLYLFVFLLSSLFYRFPSPLSCTSVFALPVPNNGFSEGGCRPP